jgi:hypothetical protein
MFEVYYLKAINNDAISAIKLMDSTGKGLPNSFMWVICGYHNQLCAKNEVNLNICPKNSPGRVFEDNSFDIQMTILENS